MEDEKVATFHLNMNNAVCKDTKSLTGKNFIFRNKDTLGDRYGE